MKKKNILIITLLLLVSALFGWVSLVDVDSNNTVFASEVDDAPFLEQNFVKTPISVTGTYETKGIWYDIYIPITATELSYTYDAITDDPVSKSQKIEIVDKTHVFKKGRENFKIEMNIKDNGNYTLTVKIPYGTGTEEDFYTASVIHSERKMDLQAPRISRQNAWMQDGGVQIELMITDKISDPLKPYNATCGIKKIEILHYDTELVVTEIMKKEFGMQPVTYDYVYEFNMKKVGKYQALMTDFNDLTRIVDFFILERNYGPYQTLMMTAQNQIENRDAYSDIVVNPLKEAYEEFEIVLLNKLSTEAEIAAAKDVLAQCVRNYTLASFTINILVDHPEHLNGDILTSLTSAHFSNARKGDTVDVFISVSFASYVKPYKNMINMSSQSRVNGVLKLDISTKMNGIVVVPKSKYNIVLPLFEDYLEYTLFSVKDPGDFSLLSYINGKGNIEFGSENATRTYILLLNVKNEAMPIWQIVLIILVVLLLIGIAVAITLVMIKQKKELNRLKGKDNIKVESSDGEIISESSQKSDAEGTKKKVPSNKSKKKKK